MNRTLESVALALGSSLTFARKACIEAGLRVNGQQVVDVAPELAGSAWDLLADTWEAPDADKPQVLQPDRGLFAGSTILRFLVEGRPWTVVAHYSRTEDGYLFDVAEDCPVSVTDAVVAFLEAEED